LEIDVADAPENVARWTGEKVQEAEYIPEDVASWIGRKVHVVEDIPQDIEAGIDNTIRTWRTRQRT
jgi:hypothetical protein